MDLKECDGDVTLGQRKSKLVYYHTYSNTVILKDHMID